MVLNNKVVAITGGCGRLGASFVKSIIQNGGKVLLGDIDSEIGKSLVREIDSVNILYQHLDVTDSESLAIFIEQGNKHFGCINAAIHSAYPKSKKWGASFEDLDSESLKEDLFGQLGGAILFSQAMIKYFKVQGSGNLLHISSIQGISAPKFNHYSNTEMSSPIEYSAIKSGVIAITRYLAKYCKDTNIRVNCISPGGIIDQQPEVFKTQYKRDCMNKGLLDSNDIDGTILFLLSDSSMYINGQNIIIDDGWSL